MFDILFNRPTVIERYQSAPLLKERLAYLEHCKEIGIKPETLCKVARHQINLVHILELGGDHAANRRKIEAAFRRWRLPEERRRHSASRRRFFKHTERWMLFLGWLDAPIAVRHTHAREVAIFITHVTDECGWSDATVEGCHRALDAFFFWLDECGTTLTKLDSATLDQFFLRCSARGYRRSTVHFHAERIRRFLRFAQQQGWCMPGLAEAILPSRRYPGEALAKGLNREEVVQLLATTEGDSPFDIRARAVLMLLITYGLRAGEVGGLQLGDVDWTNEALSVRCPKPGRTNLYPLSRSVGQSILRYLREVRPAHPDRSLFLTMRAPIKPLSRGVIKSIVFTRMNQLGIRGKRRGPHALRHAAAQHLLDQGLSLKSVGDYLGHRSAAATSVYAKVHLQSLRDIADIDLEGLL